MKTASVAGYAEETEGQGSPQRRVAVPSPSEIEPYIQKGLITQRTVRSGPAKLSIYNYTDLCADLKSWDRVTCACRGLILQEHNGEVVALPFPKFFNIDETPGTAWAAMPWGSRCAVVEKYDGALGILFYDPVARRWDIATRGAFQSPEADYARKHLLSELRLSHLDEGFTYLTEIVLRHRKLGLVHYDWEGLVLIGRRNKLTGELDWPERLPAQAEQIGAVPPRVYAASSDTAGFLRTFRATDARSEGVVVTFETELMVKVKTHMYRQFSRALRWFSGVNGLALVARGQEETLIASMPPENSVVCEACVRRCTELRDKLQETILRSFEPLKRIPDRKAFAEAVRAQAPMELQRFMFALRDGKDISRLLEAELAARFDLALGQS